MKIAQLFILILAFLVIKPVHSGVLIEPVLGYSMLNTFELDVPDSSNEKGSGPSIGARLGYQNLGFQLGLDYLRSSYSMEDNDFKENLVSNEFAFFAGFEFPILLRVYAGYIFAGNAETEADVLGSKVDVEYKDASGMKLGVGFTGLPFIDINFEYRKGEFSEAKFGSAKVDEKTDFSAYMISLSLPFVL